MKKRLITISVIVLVLVLALFALSACNAADTRVGEELIGNGTFEQYSKSDDKISFDGWKYGEDWTNSSYGRQPLTTSEQESDLELGESYLSITTKSSYAYLYQSVKVDRKAIYKISVDIKLQKSVTAGSNDTYKGANISFLENTDYIFINQTKAETGKLGWVTQTVYVRPLNTDYMTICLMLGAEGETCTGTAYFDNLSMQRVEAGAVPDNYTVHDFKKAKIARYNVDVSGVLFVVFLSLFTVFALGFAYVLIRRTYSKPYAFLNFDSSNPAVGGGKPVKGKGAPDKNREWWKNGWFIAGMLALGTFLVRLIFLLSMYGFGHEMTYTVDLAKMLGGANGVRHAYALHPDILSTTGPGSLYILAILGAMGQNLPADGLSVLIRMVNVLADMAVVVMIYFYGKKYVGNRLSTVYAALYSILPITLVMSGLNNTFESVLIALIVAGFILLVEKKYIPAYLITVLAVVLDIRALAVVPLLVTYLVYMYYRDDTNLKKFTKNRAIIIFGFIGSFIALYLLTLPAAIDYVGSKPFYGFTLIANQMLNNNIFVDNALGLYGMVGMNQKGNSSTASILNLVFILVLCMYVISLYIKNKNRQELIMLGSFMFAIVAVFTLKVTFTYLFLSIALGFIYTMISGEKRMYGILAGYGLLSFLCVGQLISNSGYAASYPADNSFVNFESTGVDFIIFSVFTVLLTLYYGYVSYSITNNGKLVDIRPMPQKFAMVVKEWCNNALRTVKIKKD